MQERIEAQIQATERKQLELKRREAALTDHKAGVDEVAVAFTEREEKLQSENARVQELTEALVSKRCDTLMGAFGNMCPSWASTRGCGRRHPWFHGPARRAATATLCDNWACARQLNATYVAPVRACRNETTKHCSEWIARAEAAQAAAQASAKVRPVTAAVLSLRYGRAVTDARCPSLPCARAATSLLLFLPASTTT